MNRFASFSFSDDKAINKLLDKYPLSGGTNVFVSEGKLLVQYQDGEEVSADVQVINFKEQINAFVRSKDEILHSNTVLDTLVADAKSRVEVAQAEVERIQSAIDEKTSNKAKVALKDDLELAQKTLKEAKGGLHEVQSAKLKNGHEVDRINLNIELFNEKIAELSK